VNRRYLAVGAAVLVAVVLIGVGTGGTGGPQLSAGDSDPAENPWGSDTITVAVVDETQFERDWQPLVYDAISYWNDNMSAIGYEGRFVYTPGTDADLVIRVVDDIDDCANANDPLGCAPVYTEVGEAVNGDWDDEKDIVIVGNLKGGVSADLIKHELGHTLGVGHADYRQWNVMRPRFATPRYDMPNASEIPNPWESQTVTVYYNTTTDELGDRHQRRLETARKYYNMGASGFLPSNISLIRTRDADAADIEIRMVNTVDEGISRWQYRGFDPDDDDAFEEYDSGIVYIEQSASPRLIIWHAGNGFGRLFGVSNATELPPPFDGSKEFDPTAWEQ
jgi:hypothetical protein